MPNNTKGRSGIRGAVLAAVGTVLVVLVFVGSLLWTMVEEDPLPAALGIMAVYALFGAAVVIGVVYALVQRLQEIKGGDADEARKYGIPQGPQEAGGRAGRGVLCPAPDCLRCRLCVFVLDPEPAQVGVLPVRGAGRGVFASPAGSRKGAAAEVQRN